MRKYFYFNKGADVRARVDVEYEDKGNGQKCFTASGTLHTPEIECGGQCLDEIAQYIDDEQFKTIYRLWKLYHLNDMHPECEHQAELGWCDKASKKVSVHTPRGVELKALGWVYEREHPDGLLCRPCPVCGYKYGTKWLYRQIPKEDETIILQLLTGKAS